MIKVRRLLTKPEARLTLALIDAPREDFTETTGPNSLYAALSMPCRAFTDSR